MESIPYITTSPIPFLMLTCFTGYKGIFKKRTNDKEDGCAIYYRAEKFDLKESATVEYNQPYVRLLNRDNIGIIARLSCKENEKNVVVANTHLLFNPNRHDIKLAQLAMLLAEIDRIAFRCQEERYTLYSILRYIFQAANLNLNLNSDYFPVISRIIL